MYIHFSEKSGKPIYIQLYETICADIISGRLPKGMKLPPRRALAHELNIAQNTVESAYKMLTDTGYAVSVPRQGYIVSYESPIHIGDTPWEINAPEKIVFSPNGIDVSKINRSAYAKIMRDIAYNDGIDIFSYVEKGGEFELRSAISKYLYSFRNVKCAPDSIIIGAGAEYLLNSVAAILPNNPEFITENPCDTHFYRTIATYGHKTITLPTSLNGFDLDALYSSKGNVLLVDTCSRFPLGQALSDNEKKCILEWAYQKEDRHIIENCSDAEILWDSQKSLFSLDEKNKVIYLGSLSRSFSPAVKTSYMVLPPEVLESWKYGHAYYYALTSKSEQFTIAEFINKGHFTKHCKAMRRTYRDKQKYLIDCMQASFNDNISILGGGSTYITAEFKNLSADTVKRLARSVGVKLFSLNSYNTKKETEPIINDRLVIGFGDLTREEIKLGTTLLYNIITTA